MIILFLLFLIQFSIASSCLAVNSEQQQELAEQGWNRVPDSMRKQVQHTFLCCGFNDTTVPVSGELSCDSINEQCCGVSGGNCHCPACGIILEDKINYAFKLCGGLGIFFSFTEVLAVFIARHYRNLQDPYHLPARAIFPNDYIY